MGRFSVLHAVPVERQLKRNNEGPTIPEGHLFLGCWLYGLNANKLKGFFLETLFQERK